MKDPPRGFFIGPRPQTGFVPGSDPGRREEKHQEDEERIKKEFSRFQEALCFDAAGIGDYSLPPIFGVQAMRRIARIPAIVIADDQQKKN